MRFCRITSFTVGICPYAQGFAAALPVGRPMQMAGSLALHDGSQLETFHSGHSIDGDAMECEEGKLSPSIGAPQAILLFPLVAFLPLALQTLLHK